MECKGHEGNGHEGNQSYVSSVVFSPDGKRLATASWDKTARVWDARTGRQLAVCKGHTGTVSQVAFSRDGTRLATAGDDGTRLWDAQTGQQLVVCKGLSGPVWCVPFSPDGAWLPTGRLWDARRLPLSPAEEADYRLWATRADPDWHNEQFQQHDRGHDRFAAAFHLDRLLAYRPEKRSELLRQRTALLGATLKQDPQNATARLLLARTAWHSPALGPQDAAALIPSPDEKGLLQRRTRAGLLLRQQKPAEAVAVLEYANTGYSLAGQPQTGGRAHPAGQKQSRPRAHLARTHRASAGPAGTSRPSGAAREAFRAASGGGLDRTDAGGRALPRRFGPAIVWV